MNEEQREKLAQVLLEESLTCADRDDLEDARDLMQRSVAIKWNHTIEKILNGDKELLKETTRKQFNGNRTDMIISRCIMNEVVSNKEWLKKNNLGETFLGVVRVMYKPEIITNAEYHGRKTHLSSTNIRTFKKNKKQFEYSLTHELVKQTKAMADGTAVHAFFLERDKFDTNFVIKPADMRLNTKAGKEWALEQKDKIIIDSELGNNLYEMEKSFMDSPAKLIYDIKGQTELSYFWDDLGTIKGKCRPDWISDDGRNCC